MNNGKVTYGLIAFCVIAILFSGCIPEDSLQWSEDGSVGLLRVDEALYLVDGQSGRLTEIARENVQPWPDISKDGSLIVYSQKVECNSLPEGLKILPPGQAEMIKNNAGLMAKSILEMGKLGMIEKFPEPDEKLLKPEDYKNWLIRYLCENTDSELSKVVGEEGMKLSREKELSYFQIVVVSMDNLNDKRIIAASIFETVATRLSPDNRCVSYIMQTQHGEEDGECSLYIASLKDDIKAMLIDERVAFGYDWRKDGKAIVYFHADSEDLSGDDAVFGTLRERVVADDNNLLAKPKENTSVETHECTGEASSFAGLVYYPWQKVRYGTEGRIFFSTCAMSLPVSKTNEGRWSLFCYDSVIGTVSEVLPQKVSNNTQVLAMLQFELSPDGKKVLLPIKNNRFVIYDLGTDSMNIPIEEDEGFGEEEIPEMIPSWKGNNEVSFLVSSESHFLTKPELQEGEERPGRNEIVILNRTDDQSRILSESWPDEIMEDLKSDKQDSIK